VIFYAKRKKSNSFVIFLVYIYNHKGISLSGGYIMKKSLLFAFFMLALFSVSANAAPCLADGQKVFCQWSANGCWQVNSTGQDASGNPTQSTCAEQAGFCPALYSGGREGEGSCTSFGNTAFTCSGCTWSEAGGLVWCDFGPPSEYGAGGCFQKTQEDCLADQGTVVASQSDCGSTPSATGPFCLWAQSEYNPTCYCGVVDGAAATKENCTDDSGEIVQSCANYCTTTPPGTPITISGHSVGLTVVPNGNVLHIISEKAATVELFSMTGAKVFSSKVIAGNSSLSLSKQRQGVYYAVVRSGSQKQTVKVVLK